jgi:NAD-dependent deacetylase sirtuin 4
MVFSVFRLIKACKERGGKLAILTAGPTRADDVADLKLEYLAGETLARVARHPTLSVPPGR